MATDFYLSSYMSPPSLAGLTSPRHDQAIALWKVEDPSVTLVRYWELERISGLKHHGLGIANRSRLEKLTASLLLEEGVDLQNVRASWGTPGFGHGDSVLPEGRIDRGGLPIHSLAHLMTALFAPDHRGSTSGATPVLGLAMDGGPDRNLEKQGLGKYWYAAGLRRGNQLDVTPTESPGGLWHAAERLSRLEPGTLMALAGATEARLAYGAASLVAQEYWGGDSMLARCYDLISSLKERAELELDVSAFPGFTPSEVAWSAVMKEVQSASEQISERLTRRALSHFGVNAGDVVLGLAGGFALNCPSNSHLAESFSFADVRVSPCSSDSGQALGNGLLGFWELGLLDGRAVNCGMPYRGRRPLDVEIVNESVEPFDVETFNRDLESDVVVWIEGESEVGPRALGHRSLLGDARSTKARDRLNSIKKRRWWRPVAPAVLEETISEWFVGSAPSPFMTRTFQVRPDREELIPGVVHRDRSARVQTLSRELNPLLHAAVQGFFDRTGCPVICNTSLNRNGEPILESVAAARDFCSEFGISVMYVNGRRVALSATQRSVSRGGPASRDFTGPFVEDSVDDASDWLRDHPLRAYAAYMDPIAYRAAEEGRWDVVDVVVDRLRARNESFDVRALDFAAVRLRLLTRDRQTLNSLIDRGDLVSHS